MFSLSSTVQPQAVLNLRDLGLSELKIGHIDQLVDSLLPGFCKGKNVSSHWHTSHVSAQSFFENKYDMFSTLRSSGLYRQRSRTLKSICSDLQYWPDSLRRTRLILFVLLLFGIYGLLKNPFLSVRFRTTTGLDSAVDPVQMKNVTFEHVKGVEEAKQELQEVVEFLKNPQKFTVLGGKLPKGEAKANAPCVIFIDELDSVGGKRIESPMHPYSRQTINQLLAEMDGALIRPGRFDMQVTVPRPDVRGRTEILKWYLNKIKFDQSVDPEIIARGTVGFSGAELENLVNQAALKAAVDGKEMVTMKELEFSKDKILMGPERRSVEIDNKNKTITAYHESGHAIIAYYTKDAMPINKATIMPRGPTLGHDSYERAKHILKTHAKEHKNLAEALLTYETLDAKEIQVVLEGKKLEVR
ncbi:hypothetical protein HPG69_012418 [Diceros bicornis minor]|uniref:Uncharacterized protein n=1 Tax=Diceros bicornis minor TaxID=77932 RepID=A0A7J7FMB2_DICBM|nr:hypothetical protein HPG69_012418 [Diceros bicornis minor]